jgi:hypothetical protein
MPQLRGREEEPAGKIFFRAVSNRMNIVRVLDPRLAFQTSHNVYALGGSQYINSVQFPTNNISDSSIVIQANPSSERVSVDANIHLHCSFSITVNGTNSSSQPLLISSMFGPSFMPLRQVITSETLTINGTAASIANPHLFFPAMASSYDGNLWGAIDREYSMTPSMPDMSAQFLTLPASATSIRNPLSSVYDATIMTPRGAFVGFNTVSNAPSGTTSSFTLDCAEPIIVSPLRFGKGSFNEPGLVYINNLLYNATIANLNRVLSIAYPLSGGTPTYSPLSGGTIAITSVVVHLTLAELLIFNYSLNDYVPRPMNLLRAYNEVIDYNVTSFQSLAPGASVTLNLNNQTLGSIPRSIYIFVPVMPDTFTQTSNASACTVPVAFLQMASGTNGFLSNSDYHPLTINFDNVTQMQGFTIMDLYKISVKNGLSMDFSEFVGMGAQYPNSTGRGTCLKLNMGEDVTLNEGFTVGVAGKYNLTVTVTVWNQTQLTLPSTTLHVVAVYDGLATTTSDTQTINHQASFTPAQVQAAGVNPDIRFTPQRELFGGGDFFSSLKSGLESVGNFLKGSKLVSTLAPVVGTVLGQPAIGATIGQAARSLGYGGKGEYRRKPRKKQLMITGGE